MKPELFFASVLLGFYTAACGRAVLQAFFWSRRD